MAPARCTECTNAKSLKRTLTICCMRTTHKFYFFKSSKLTMLLCKLQTSSMAVKPRQSTRRQSSRYKPHRKHRGQPLLLHAKNTLLNTKHCQAPHTNTSWLFVWQMLAEFLDQPMIRFAQTLKPLTDGITGLLRNALHTTKPKPNMMYDSITLKRFPGFTLHPQLIQTKTQKMNGILQIATATSKRQVFCLVPIHAKIATEDMVTCQNKNMLELWHPKQSTSEAQPNRWNQ